MEALDGLVLSFWDVALYQEGQTVMETMASTVAGGKGQPIKWPVDSRVVLSEPGDAKDDLVSTQFSDKKEGYFGVLI